jgi:D-glycero-D-manno-heptose 1,7-bisphosphate phosphatase
MEVNFTILLDRDGVINRDSPDYIKNWDEFQFLPGALEALNLFAGHGLGVIIITNQSVINRGMVLPEVLEETHHRLRQAVERTGGRIQDIFFCPHRPDEDCACRKPKPGLIIQAQTQYHLDPRCCIMIGDSAKDIEAGFRAGCGATILVRTADGGKAALAELSAKQLKPTETAEDLLDAARMIIAGQVPMAD